MRVAIGQFAVEEDWRANAGQARGYLREASAAGVDLLVLPEDSMALFIDEPGKIRDAAQPVDGPYVSALREGSAETPGMTTVFGMHEPGVDGKVYNTLVAIRGGEVLATYRKLHLYDAFGARESDRVAPGSGDPVVIDCAGWKIGLMTCYDVRFPELARLLVDAGAQAIACPTAWVRGPLKEWHWEVMVTARALDNTCYLIGAGECGRRNIGSSLVVDPLGTAVARLGTRPGLLFAELDPELLTTARENLPVLANRRFRVDPTVRELAAP
ncbi:nitrilase-related carbon-nitrogen hydrolase [Sciscionella marina]|uniref:nitrilase-related carbon-nitrogen hydrolase n=1 Tax=Sciscionella marina TaxID=508770 RepID=UPI00036D4E60|nr:nitrilase-related carbon-nitrogen hydrolase [Sciscionella marina]